MDFWVAMAITSTTLLPFSYVLGKRKGYVIGGRRILAEWRKFNEEMGNHNGN